MNTQKINALLSDEQIIELFFQRDESAISHTDDKYGKYLHTIAYNILNNAEDCNECLNDTYYKTWNAIPPTRPGIFRGFLSKLMRNTALDRYESRRAKRRVPAENCFPFEDFEGFISDTDQTDSKEIGRIITEYLDSVSDRNMYFFISRYFLVIPIADIAKKSGCSVSTVNKQLAVMKRQLRELFAREGIGV
ncbi:MAG: sigma-70 family RNA polymerase sigma factor [Clostridia bacterium]|nr:sigma-70 family RNA polymerase sigma factor [Clostridia bacterium]